MDDTNFLYSIIPFLSSAGYLKLIYAQAKFGSYESGAIKKLPVPPLSVSEQNAHWLRAYEFSDQIERVNETCSLFALPPSAGWSAAALNKSMLEAMETGLRACNLELDPEVIRLQTEVASKLDEQLSFHRTWLSWAVGVVFGRWDIRLATGDRPVPPLLDPFAPLPIYSPGMLPDGIVPSEYPLRVDEDGILVEDEGHEDDIVARVREVLRLVFKEGADAFEREACERLSVKSLRDYFRRPGKGGFWDDHVQRYSKSRRKAPIYWLLQSRDKGYSVWLYYHKLSPQTLPKVVGERYVGAKIRRVQRAIRELRPQDGTDRPLSKKDERNLDEMQSLQTELDQLHDQLRAVMAQTNDRGEVAGYAPDLNDGALLNAAPLHAVIPWPDKKKHKGRTLSELALCWEQIAEGGYDWAHIAMHYFPKHVEEKCAEDRSLAVAHGLDEQLFPGLREEFRRRADDEAPEGEAADDDDSPEEDSE